MDRIRQLSQECGNQFFSFCIHNKIVCQINARSVFFTDDFTSRVKVILFAVIIIRIVDALDSFAEKWDGKYPKIAQSWRDNWPNLSTYFKSPEEVRRLIYTTNAIEGFNRQLRKVTKAKSVFPTDDSLFKMLYLAMMDITKKWTGRRQDWSRIHAQLAVYFAERMPD